MIALIALLSSYDHIALSAGDLQLPQQWRVWFIVASVALVVVVAEGCDAKQLLNWRRDPGYEQRKMQHKLRMKQLESEIEQLRQENRRLAELESRIDALLRNSDSYPPTPPATGSSD